ncbi:cadherin repeat domain-containing protein [Tenacibaculum sp. SG-28]|uniref:cadherin repeat domain-containing protein n=1 Tax=Tenacibaculum sp. SG-28 TaxID=754426 RepID=UPI000CF3B3A2|nr:cadherin repeat domain-containing protein [Tenacibaculum sp. SG-28]PQJ20616.1 hypothetical protein BSU00_09895 [Tenacibaculum sp. SG-28]
MKNHKLFYLLVILTFFIISCEDSNDDVNDTISISISDFSISIDENPTANSSLGIVQATTNQGDITFSITEQTPKQAIQINASTGEITVLTESLFDYETNPIVTGIVRAENSGISETASITINLNDINEIDDDYKLLAVSELGEVYEIGNNTGNIENIGQINRENNGSILSTNNLISSSDKIYSIEYVYNPSPTNNLLIFDRKNRTSQIIPLTIPSTINGDERGIIALTKDENNLIGVLAENVLRSNSTKHLVNINLQDNSITELGITFNEDVVTSVVKINSKLYISTWREGFLEVDLVDNSVNNINSINGSRLASINNSELAVMQSVSGSTYGAKPGIIDLTTMLISDKSKGETYSLMTVFGNTIYENGIYLNLVSSNSLNLYLGILKSNFGTNENSIVEINSTSVSQNLIILDKTE